MCRVAFREFVRSLKFSIFLVFARIASYFSDVRGGWRIISLIQKFEPAVWPPKIISRNGIRWRIAYAKDHVSRALVYRGTYEMEATRWVKKVLRPGSVCLDIGANSGYYSMLFGKIVGKTGRVIAFEPSPDFLTRLRNHVDLNGLNNVVSFQKGLSDETGTLELIQGGCNATFFSGRLNDENSQAKFADEHHRQHYEVRKYSVPISTIDTELKNLGIDRVDLIKMDIEGFEQKCIRGGLNTIERFRPYLLVEYSPVLGGGLRRTLKEVLGALESLNYRFMRDDYPTAPLTLSELEETENRQPIFGGACNICCLPALDISKST